MYGWLWRHLPGPLVLRLLQTTALLVVAVAVLFLWVFPWVEAQLPYSDVTVPAPSTTSGPTLPAG